jgi:hypothetical protein
MSEEWTPDITPTSKSNIKRWLVASVIGSATIVVILLLSPFVLPKADPYGWLRGVLDRVLFTIVGNMLFSGGLLFLDYVTPGETLEEINKDPIASAIVCAAYVYGLVTILTSV